MESTNGTSSWNPKTIKSGDVCGKTSVNDRVNELIWSILAQLNVKRNSLVIVAIQSVVCNDHFSCMEVCFSLKCAIVLAALMDGWLGSSQSGELMVLVKLIPQIRFR
jgi:translation elongation factor EF-1alpha